MSPTTENDTEASAAFRLGKWTVEPSLNRITRGPASVQLEPRAMDVLVFLARHPAEVLSQQAIRAGLRAVELALFSRDAVYGTTRLEDLAVVAANVGECDAPST